MTNLNNFKLYLKWITNSYDSSLQYDWKFRNDNLRNQSVYDNGSSITFVVSAYRLLSVNIWYSYASMCLSVLHKYELSNNAPTILTECALPTLGAQAGKPVFSVNTNPAVHARITSTLIDIWRETWRLSYEQSFGMLSTSTKKEQIIGRTCSKHWTYSNTFTIGFRSIT